MNDGSDQPRTRQTPQGLEPGTLSTLLQELAEIPDAPSDVGWSGWLVPGLVVGRFELVREVGHGGFGVVWEARDRDLRRNVAFKAIRAGRKAALREERLLREAEAAARLSHPNLVTLYDVGHAEHGPYLVMELLKGETLADRVSAGAIAVPEAVRIAIEVAKGVAHAHANGVVHRDLKPANILLCDDGRVKVLDFGLAHAFGQRREDGGTPAYMAPEQSAGAPEDERTDVFAMGGILFQMLSGELPFPDESSRRRAVRFSWNVPVLDVPTAPALGDLVGRMLDRDPTRRPRDGTVVLQALCEAQKALEGAAPSSAAPARARRRRRWPLAAAAAVVVLLGAALGLAIAPRSSARYAVGHDGRLVVAVADFANETRDPDLDGLSGLLITSLEQSSRLRVVTRGHLVDVVHELGATDASHLDESLARAAGRKAGVNALLLASIQKLGDTYAAELRALDPSKDEYLFTVREQATSKNELLPLIDRMSDRARIALREPDAEVKGSGVNVAEAVTPSLEAYRHYFRGKELAGRGRTVDAVAEYRKALDIAPRFAVAQAELAWVGYFAGETRQAARAAIEAAARDAARAPDKEARLIRILAAFFDARFATARSEIRSLTERYPDDADATLLAAVVLAWSGDDEGAVPLFDRGLRAAPEWDFLRQNQLEALFAVGRGKEGLALAEEAARTRATTTARVALGVARYLSGDLDGGIAAFRSAAAEDGLAAGGLAVGLAEEGRLEEARAALAMIKNPIVADMMEAQVLAHAGRLRDGLARIDAAARRPRADVGMNRQRAAWYVAAAGDLERARRLAAEGQFFTVRDGVMLSSIGDERRLGALLAEIAPDTLPRGRFLRALEQRRAGNGAQALAELRALDRGGVSLVPYFHGLAAAEAGLDEEAVEALRRFEGPVLGGALGFDGPWLLARARYLTARSLERLGRPGEARAVVDLQLARWKGADRELPLLAELKALRARLGAAAEASRPR